MLLPISVQVESISLRTCIVSFCTTMKMAVIGFSFLAAQCSVLDCRACLSVVLVEVAVAISFDS